MVFAQGIFENKPAGLYILRNALRRRNIMKKTVFFITMAVVLLGFTSVYAEARFEKTFYASVAGNLAVEGIDRTHGQGLAVDFGYNFTEQLSAELNYVFVNNFGIDNPVTYGDIDVRTYMASVKYHSMMSKWSRGFLTCGLGCMRIERDDEGKTPESESREHDFCGKIGGGFDFFLTDRIALELEADYTYGLGDVSKVDYFNYLLGVQFLF